MLPSVCSQDAVGGLDGSGRTRGCAAPLRFLTDLFRQEQAVISCPVGFFFEELFTLHPACLWARETLGLGLKLWTNRHETFSTACIISVVETYLCHNQLVKRQYCLDWLLCHGVFLSGNHGSWNSSIYFLPQEWKKQHLSLWWPSTLGFCTVKSGHGAGREQSSTNKVPAPLSECFQQTLDWDLWQYSCSSTWSVCLKQWLVSKVDVPCFFPAKYYGMDCFLQFLTPKHQMKLLVAWSMKSLIVNRENVFSQISGNAIAIELVIAACGSHSVGILSLTPLYIWSKNAFSLSLCSTR